MLILNVKYVVIAYLIASIISEALIIKIYKNIRRNGFKKTIKSIKSWQYILLVLFIPCIIVNLLLYGVFKLINKIIK